jgi:hypothetical protein
MACDLCKPLAYSVRQANLVSFAVPRSFKSESETMP